MNTVFCPEHVMNNKHLKQFLLTCLLLAASVLLARNNYTQYVNPFVGTGGHGHTFPGATTPFAMVQLSPDTRIDGSWDGCSGYHYSDSIIYGFSHTHLSGTGCSDYGDIAFMPTFVSKAIEPIWKLDKLSASFSHKSEKAIPGYYSVKLDNGVFVELTATTRVGFQKYTYAQNGYAWITLDLKHRDALLAGKITQIDKHTFSGLRRSEAWAIDQLLYYYFQVSKDADQIHITKESNGETKINLGFHVRKGESVLIKTALSSVDEKGAQNNLEKELPHWDFNRVSKEANLAWNLELNRIKVYGGTLTEKQNFYTALYHCMMHPNVLNDVDGRYMGRDKKIHVADGFDYYTVFSLWDTYRALHPLLNIIDKKRSHDFMMTFRAQWQQSLRFPMWELWGNETNCMIGFHSVSVIQNAYLRGVIDTDELSGLYGGVVVETLNNRAGFGDFKTKGYLSAEDESESVSKTLEYSYNMHCAARIAGSLGKTEDAQRYSVYADAWRNVRNAKTGFMTPRVNGGWLAGFDPREVNNHYTEANAWQYTFAVQHDLKSIYDINLLSRLFNTESKTTGREQADITGLIGQYAHGNEPSHHFAYLFNNIDSTSKYVRKICSDFYKPTPDGLCGNEDCGQMSAWYVFSAMGIYPANPSESEMVFGNMLFDSVRFVQGDGSAVIYKNIRPETHGLKGGFMVKSNSIKIFGNANRYYLGYDVLRSEKELSHSALSAPVIHSASEVFRDSILVHISSNNKSEIADKIYYTLDGSEPTSQSAVYADGQLLKISQSCILKAKSILGEQEASPAAVARFYRYYNDFPIRYNCTYNKQYTAGGDNGLLDGLIGDIDWRKGRWQGYQSQDFEVLIDLKKPMFFDTISIGFLQDKRSWIFLPDWITVYGSEDSVHFEELNTGDYLLDEKDMSTGRYPMVFSGFKKATPYRYIKVFAKNYGKLPAWHPGAGGDAFIFVDEIEIR